MAGCDSTGAFASRGEFAAHLTEHRFNTTWSCKKCGYVDTDRGKFRSHLDSEHSGIPAEHILNIVKTSERRTPRNLEHEKCPLCGEIPTAMKYIGHVSHHLEELSLSAIPQGVDPDSDSDLSCSSSHADILEPSVTAPNNSDYYPSSLHPIPKSVFVDPEQGCTRISSLDTKAPWHSEANDRGLTPPSLTFPSLTTSDFGLGESAFKVPWRRPANGKIKCKVCNDGPEFRGKFELSRHMERKHSTPRTFWICIDISPDQKMLANCKQCKAGKRYGAYYNAAAHLRRVHFSPRPRGRKGKDALYGGEWPSTKELKKWMEEKVEYTDAPKEDADTIKCICGFEDDDGRTVLCEKCDTWQHVACYYYTSSVDDNHDCADCNPGRLIDREKAIKHQREKRKVVDKSLGGIDQTLQSNSSTLRQTLQ